MGQCLAKDKRRFAPPSEQGQVRQVEPANQGRPEPQRRAGSQRTLGIGRDPGSQRPGTPRLEPPHSPTTISLTTRLRYEYMRALYCGLKGLEYAVIGGAAIAEYGLDQGTSDIDVIVPSGTEEKAIEQLLRRDVNIVRTTSGRPGYMASDGKCYGLDIIADQSIGLKFQGVTDSIVVAGIQTRVANMPFLLNSRAASYLNREDPRKRESDGAEIFFLLGYMASREIRLGEQAARQCKWLFNPRFWTTFTTDFPGQEAKFTAIGFWPHTTSTSTSTPRLERVFSRRIVVGESIRPSPGGNSGRRINGSQSSRESLDGRPGHRGGSIRSGSTTSSSSGTPRGSSIWTESQQSG